VVIFHQHAFQQHFRKKRKIDMVDADLCMEVTRKLGGDPSYQPVLSKRGLDKQPGDYQ
jgi:hypothetical protein